MFLDSLGDISDVATAVNGTPRYPSRDGVVRIQVGDTIDLSVDSIPEPPSPSWLKNGEVIEGSARIELKFAGVFEGKFTYTLTVRDATESDSGGYTAVFMNDAEVFSTSTDIRVVGEHVLFYSKMVQCVHVSILPDANAPVILRRPDVEPQVTDDSVTARIGRPVVVARQGQRVVIQGDTLGPQVVVRWYRGDGSFINIGSQLEISDFGEDDVGDYIMVADNDQDTDRETVTLRLASSPKISSPGPITPERPLIDEDKDYTVGEPGDVIEGRTVTVRASFSGEPRGDIRWTLPSGATLRVGQSSNRVSVENNGDLIITDTQPGDSGDYTFIVTNEEGEENVTTAIRVLRTNYK